MYNLSQHRVAFSYGLLLPWVLACSLLVTPVALAQAVTDIDPPAIDHTPDDMPGTAGEMQRFSAEVTDDQAVQAVSLHFRRDGDSTFQMVPMEAQGSGSRYTASIPTDGGDLRAIEYYIQASDTAGNRVLKGYAFNPLVRPMQAPGQSASAGTGSTPAPEPQSSGRRWLWIGLGVLAVGGAAAALAGGGDDDPGNTFTVTIPPPQ